MTRVCVTGATGFIASVLIDLLVSKGYSVAGTVRSVDSQWAKELQAKFPSLELFAADLLVPGSFDAAFAGADVVMHTASPFVLKVDDPQKELVDPAVNGTLNVLQAAANTPTVKRVVVTSSCAAIGPPQTKALRDKLGPDFVANENVWLEDASLQDGPYRLSKVLAEKAAWKFVEDNSPKFDLAVINPSFVLGPPVLSRVEGTSITSMYAFLSGKAPKIPVGPLAFGTVDVRDIALAHVAAMEKPEAGGKRFILSSSRGSTAKDVVDILANSQEFGHFPLPKEFDADAVSQAYVSKYDHSRAVNVLGLALRPLDESVLDMARALVKLGMVDEKKKDEL